jgi:hypothetical protein
VSHGPPKHSIGHHRNAEPDGACHYFRSRTGQRILLREEEIDYVEPTPLGAVVRTKKGVEYKVTSPRPEQIVAAG